MTSIRKRKKSFKIFDHTADIGLELHGKTLKDLFVTAGQAVVMLTVDQLPAGHPFQRKVCVQGKDRESLLVAWINEILYRIQSKKFLPNNFYIASLTDTACEAVLKGETLHPRRHRVLREIKSATFHQLAVTRSMGGWKAKVVLDV